MQREMDRLLDTVWGRTPTEPTTWTVPADVIENDSEIRCSLEVPGLAADDINITVENGNVLLVSGEKRFQHSDGDEKKGTYHQERRYGRFERSFILPRNVDASKINAAYDQGVVTIVLPKSEESKPRRVQVAVGTAQQQISAAQS